MAYDRPLLRMSWGGPHFGQEHWSTGLHFARVPTSGETTITPGAHLGISPALLRTALEEFYGLVYSLSTERSPVSWIKVAPLATDGKYAEEAFLHEFDPIISTSRSTQLPPQIAVCVSLWTGKRFGRGNRGRLYLPTPATAVGPDGLLDLVTAERCRNNVAKLLQDLAAAVTSAPNLADLQPVVASEVGAGRTQAISYIGVGRVLDTQRRRRRSLDEDTDYETIAAAASGPRT